MQVSSSAIHTNSRRSPLNAYLAPLRKSSIKNIQDLELRSLTLPPRPSSCRHFHPLLPLDLIATPVTFRPRDSHHPHPFSSAPPCHPCLLLHPFRPHRLIVAFVLMLMTVGPGAMPFVAIAWLIFLFHVLKPPLRLRYRRHTISYVRCRMSYTISYIRYRIYDIALLDIRYRMYDIVCF